MADKQNTPKIETIEITNFGGRLTRLLNGDLNSGFAKFITSYGYDPFSKPGNLTWFESVSNITGPITDLILAGKMRWLGESNPALYAVGSKGKLYKIQVNSTSNPAVASVIGVASVIAGGATYTSGASIDFFGSTEKIYVGSDSQLNSINFDGSADSVVGNAANYAANVFRPLKQFSGNLLFGNGPTIGAVGATGSVISSVIGVSSAVGNIYSQLNPALPVEARVRDLDVSPDNNYALITASNLDYELIASPNSSPNRSNTVPTEGNVYAWNGSDAAVTAGTTLPANFVSALQTYLQSQMFFTADTFGANLMDGTNKILTLPKNKAPFPNATGVNGNFIFWMAPENAPFNSDGTLPTLFASMYYFGSLDQENPPGLYRMFRVAPSLINGNIVQAPFNQLVSISYSDLNTSQSSVFSAGTGQHYFSTLEVKSTSSVLSLNSFNVPATGTGTPQIGVYETQTQLFSKRIAIKQIRVYTEPTVANNSFHLDLIGSDGQVITGGNLAYTYVAGTDPTLLQGSLERINFNPANLNIYALGLRLTNFGSVNMTIKKIEVDWTEAGK